MSNTDDKKSIKYKSVSEGVPSLNTVVPKDLGNEMFRAMTMMKEALNGDVVGFVADRLDMATDELKSSLASEQVDGVALALYNIEARGQALIIGDQTGVGKGRQAAALIRYGLKNGYFPIFFTDRYTLFSDMYRDCKALGIADARPFVMNANATVVDFDKVITEDDFDEDLIVNEDEDDTVHEMSEKEIKEKMKKYEKKYEIVYRSLKQADLKKIVQSKEFPYDKYEYIMLTYSQLKDSERDDARLKLLQSICSSNRVMFVFDEAHRGSSSTENGYTTITRSINKLLIDNPHCQCVFLSATFAKRPESLITFIYRTALSETASQRTLETALIKGGTPMQEYLSSSLAMAGQMIRRENSDDNLPYPSYTYLDDESDRHAMLFDKAMSFFREISKLSTHINKLCKDLTNDSPDKYKFKKKQYHATCRLFYLNKVLLLSLKAIDVAKQAVKDVQEGKSVVIAMSDTLECIFKDVVSMPGETIKGDFTILLQRLLERAVIVSSDLGEFVVFDLIDELPKKDTTRNTYFEIKRIYEDIKNRLETDRIPLPLSPIDVIRQIVTSHKFNAPNGKTINIRFDECTGRVKQIHYSSPEGDDCYLDAVMESRKKRPSNIIYNDFQNNLIDVLLINSCGAMGASAHAVPTSIVPKEQVRQRKMLIVQNDLDVNIDLQKRGRICRTGQIEELPPLYEYVITSIPSEKRLNMMLRAKLRSLSANISASQDYNKDIADFIDIDNHYGDLVVRKYLEPKVDLLSTLNISPKTISASLFLARTAMLNVSKQREIIDEVFYEYKQLESDLRRINQWDLERVKLDLKAELIDQDIFTVGRGDSLFGGNSYLCTYRCQLKSFPKKAEEVEELVKKRKKEAMTFVELKTKAMEYYKTKYEVYEKKCTARRESILEEAKYYIANMKRKKKGFDEKVVMDWLVDLTYRYCDANELNLTYTQYEDISSFKYRIENTYNSLENYRYDLDLEWEKITRLYKKFKIGDYIESFTPAKITTEQGDYIPSAVFLGFKFGSKDEDFLLPSRVKATFSTTNESVEFTINLAETNERNGFYELNELDVSSKFKPEIWDKKIGEKNVRTVLRNIIIGNLLGAYVNPIMRDLNTSLVTFSLKSDGDEEKTRYGLLVPSNATHKYEMMSTVAMPIEKGIRYMNKNNAVYVISGLSASFSIDVRIDNTIHFRVRVGDKDSRKFETDDIYDSIRAYFIGTSYRSGSAVLFKYSTLEMDFDNKIFQEILKSLSKFGGTVQIPSSLIKVADNNALANGEFFDEQSMWPKLNWENGAVIPPSPIYENLEMDCPEFSAVDDDVNVVDKYSYLVELAKTYLEFAELTDIEIDEELNNKLSRFRNDLFRYTYIPSSSPYFGFNALAYDNINLVLKTVYKKRKLSERDWYPNLIEMSREIASSEILSEDGKIREMYLTLVGKSPELSVVQKLLDSCNLGVKMNKIRANLKNYIDGKIDKIPPINNFY